MNPDSTVETATGALRGCRENGVHVFRGVPYAQPPVGERRFRSPLAMESWSEARDATHSGPASYQTNNANRDKVKVLVKEMNLGTAGIPPRPDYSEETYSQQNASEDCLYLDIWVPDGGSDKRLPVYIYYHGGANASSSGHNRFEDASNLCREERIIVVRPTYREGLLGWGHFGLITDLLPEAVNLGLQDQIAALHWVHENAASFGGDRDNITIGGESAGATAVSGLLTYPPTQGLARRAILQSFTPFHAWSTQERQEGVAMAELILQLLEITDPAELLTLDPDKFLAAHNVLVSYMDPDKNCSWSPVGPVVDRDLTPQLPVSRLATAEFPKRDFEVMIGFAKDEWQYSRGQSHTSMHGTETDVKKVFSQVFGRDGADEIYRIYRELYPSHEEPGHTLGDVMSFEFFKYGQLSIAHNFALQGIPTYVFQFSLDLPGFGGFLRATHTGDMPIIFRNLTDDVLSHFPGFDGLDRGELRAIATEFGAMYGAFIRSGDPGPRWPRFDERDATVMWLGKNVEARSNLLSAEWDAFRSGVGDIDALQRRLADNTRKALNLRRRAFATDRKAGAPVTE